RNYLTSGGIAYDTGASACHVAVNVAVVDEICRPKCGDNVADLHVVVVDCGAQVAEREPVRLEDQADRVGVCGFGLKIRIAEREPLHLTIVLREARIDCRVDRGSAGRGNTRGVVAFAVVTRIGERKEALIAVLEQLVDVRRTGRDVVDAAEAQPTRRRPFAAGLPGLDVARRRVVRDTIAA